jgi:hypothetical protein
VQAFPLFIKYLLDDLLVVVYSTRKCGELQILEKTSASQDLFD